MDSKLDFGGGGGFIVFHVGSFLTLWSAIGNFAVWGAWPLRFPALDSPLS